MNKSPKSHLDVCPDPLDPFRIDPSFMGHARLERPITNTSKSQKDVLLGVEPLTGRVEEIVS